MYTNTFPIKIEYILIYNQFKEFTFSCTHTSTTTQVYAKNCLISSKNSVCFKFSHLCGHWERFCYQYPGKIHLSYQITSICWKYYYSQRNYRLLLFGGTINRILFIWPYLTESFIQIYRNQVSLYLRLIAEKPHHSQYSWIVLVHSLWMTKIRYEKVLN